MNGSALTGTPPASTVQVTPIRTMPGFGSPACSDPSISTPDGRPGVDHDRVRALLDEQRGYYAARAAEYDTETWRADVDPELAEGRSALSAVLERFAPTGDVLELGCGTGRWSSRLAAWADHLTALDSSPEMVARAKRKVPRTDVEWIVADLFTWTPPRRFDVVSFAFVLSHVPRPVFDDFWHLVAACLRPKGRVCFLDTGMEAVLGEDLVAERGTSLARRRLRDGRDYRVVKEPWSAADLELALRERGWDATVSVMADRFLWGTAQRR